MIKIELNNVTRLQQDYFTAVAPKVVFRLEILQTALQHAMRNNLPTKKILHFTEISTVTRKIINKMRVRAVPKTRFKQKFYRKTVLYYTDPKRFASKIKLQDILDLVTKLLEIKNGELRQLLTGPPTGLSKTNKDLEKDFNVYGEAEKDILSLAFDYEAYDKITDEIKLFFRTRNLVHYCPYCNQEPAMYNGLPSGKTIRVHQLDHFFDKASYPLLCYSFFNLVPGDWTCNSINKGRKPFSDKNHLNPYTAGFGKAMVFEPDYDTAGMQMINISLKVDPKAPMEIRRQLLGSKLKLDENDKEGNINVFGLHSKYNLEQVKVEASKVHRRFLGNLNNLPTLHGYLSQLPLVQALDYYSSWYEEEIRAPFEPERFHEQRYSKLFRDMHDFVFKNDTQIHNKLIREITDHFS